MKKTHSEARSPSKITLKHTNNTAHHSAHQLLNSQSKLIAKHHIQQSFQKPIPQQFHISQFNRASRALRARTRFARAPHALRAWGLLATLATCACLISPRLSPWVCESALWRGARGRARQITSAHAITAPKKNAHGALLEGGEIRARLAHLFPLRRVTIYTWQK